ncbi:restriction endonuclease subunit S [uncultured Alistipes sp.]|uniref:restriction endonuclease subunit S n=1 Tax=uncultured Alistipes sp. TaxID=538949 RepID=UPI002593B203|nr:restriction endonuclease subunit S [uncultured Alistipes sp.]
MGNNIPQGYKATALGIIPQEWEVMRLGDIVSITSGESPSLYHLKAEGKYPYVKVEDLNNCEKYQESSREYSDDNNTTIKAGSIIFPKRGASILNNKVRIAAKDIQMDSNMMAITPHTAIVDTEFLYIRILHERLYRIADTSSIPQINNKHIIPYKIAVPPLAEQRKIAEVLGVWDEAIEKQARLIEKLALRKRALMQRLLSAKLRLPGFSEPWKIHKLQELFTERNETNRTDLPLLSITGDRGVILQTESEKRDTSNDDKSKYKRIAKGDIGYNTMRMWQGRSALSGLEGIVSPAYTIVVPNTTDVDGYYMSVLFKQPRLVYDFWTHSQGLVGDTLNCKYRDFGQVHICCPPLAEQKAITEVLTAADREIELAKEKLERLRRQKRSLMQQLLTGKKRVI